MIAELFLIYTTISSTLSLQEPSYVVIFDAGSTGTRISAYRFNISAPNGELILDNEFYYEVTPGLSSFAHNPRDGLKTLDILIEKAKTVIPDSAWSRTPVSLKATAGLRLLPKDKADIIIEECKNYFQKSGFLTNKDSISIMDGTDEGIFAWFTVNYLIGRLSSYLHNNTVAVLDLGGASTQVTYLPDEQDLKMLTKHVYTQNVFGHNITLYAHSSLGMGLMFARKAILTADLYMENIRPGDTVETRSKCINPMVSANWSYGGINYFVRGSFNYTGFDQDNFRMSECAEIIKNYINTTVQEKPVGLNKQTIYPISYYFDCALEAGLIDEFTGGVITLEDFHQAAITICKNQNVDKPFICLDMTYIYILLHDFFGIENSSKLNLYRKYNDYELTWSLGAAFALLG